MPAGSSTEKITIGDSSFMDTFIVLPTCCKDLITGMDFLREYGTIINIPDHSVMFHTSPDLIPCLLPQHNSFCLIKNGGIVPPWSCILVLVVCEVRFHCEEVADQVTPL